MTRTQRSSAGTAAILLLAATVSAPATAISTPSDPPRRGAVSDHVVVISIDGLRPDAIEASGARTLARLMREGAFALDAQTILPSKTLPSHTSMLTGVVPEVHGITWNSDRTGELGVVAVETIFELAHEAGLQTAAFFSKSKFHHLEREGSLDHTQAPDGMHHMMSTRTVADVVSYLRHERPNLLFVHVPEPDYAGHAVGWMSFVYRAAVRRADAAVGRVLEAADEAYGPDGYTVVVTADHGGHGRDHGTDDPQDTTIPWIAWGAGVQQGSLRSGIRTMDTAATVLWLLGVDVPDRWAGRPVTTAFDALARYAADLRQETDAPAVSVAGMPTPAAGVLGVLPAAR